MKYRLLHSCALALCFLSASCSLAVSREPGRTLTPCGWAYQLQDLVVADVTVNETFDLVVMDYSSDGGESGEWSPAEIAAIKAGGKLAIAYISIGEAEDYRYYWDPAWETNPPAWLGPENPDWPGNYKVRFWMSGWQTIVLDYVDRILDQGFDGVYMDIIDAYYYWSEEVGTYPDADNWMIAWVAAIRQHVDASGQPSFIMIPQNGAFIVVEDGVTQGEVDLYYGAIDAIGVEDVFFPGGLDENNPYDPDGERIAMLADYQARGLTVFSVEYLTEPDLISLCLDAAGSAGYVPYVGLRELNTLNDGFCVTGVPDGSSLLLSGPFPCPARGTVSLEYECATGRRVTLRIFDTAGRLVAEEKRGNEVFGRFDWDCHDLSGRRVASGVYLAEVEASRSVHGVKLVVLR